MLTLNLGEIAEEENVTIPRNKSIQRVFMPWSSSDESWPLAGKGGGGGVTNRISSDSLLFAVGISRRFVEINVVHW